MNNFITPMRPATRDTFRAYHQTYGDADFYQGRLMDAPEIIPAGSVRLYKDTPHPFIGSSVILRGYA